MIGFLDDIRNSENLIYNRRNIINIIAVMFFRIAVVTFSKNLDFCQVELPNMLMAIDTVLDVHSFIGRFAI